jgi:chemotaxis protein methyltransferase CheR
MAKETEVPLELRIQFSAFLENTIGLYVPQELWNRIDHKLLPLAHAFGFTEVLECIRFLLKNRLTHQQISTLAIFLSIKETYFFRDPQVFAVLKDHVLTKIINERRGKNQHIKIWCSACCTGEEPYSMAIGLQKLLPNYKEWRLFILGTDINLDTLEIARTGRYRDWSMRATADDIKRSFFTQVESGIWEIIPAIRKMVKFGYTNLVDGIYPIGMDIIICNNILIYFSPNQIQKTIKKLTDALSPGGYLFVSPVEVPFVNDPRLNRMLIDSTTFFVKDLEVK